MSSGTPQAPHQIFMTDIDTVALLQLSHQWMVCSDDMNHIWHNMQFRLCVVEFDDSVQIYTRLLHLTVKVAVCGLHTRQAQPPSFSFAAKMHHGVWFWSVVAGCFLIAKVHTSKNYMLCNDQFELLTYLLGFRVVIRYVQVNPTCMSFMPQTLWSLHFFRWNSVPWDCRVLSFSQHTTSLFVDVIASRTRGQPSTRVEQSSTF